MTPEAANQHVRNLARRVAAERGRAANRDEHELADALTNELEALNILLDVARASEAPKPKPKALKMPKVWPRGTTPLGKDESGMSPQDWAALKPNYPALVTRAIELGYQRGRPRLSPVGASESSNSAPVRPLDAANVEGVAPFLDNPVDRHGVDRPVASGATPPRDRDAGEGAAGREPAAPGAPSPRISP